MRTTGRPDLQEHLAARLLEVLDDAVVGTDPDFRITVWNPGAERLYGYPLEEVLGRPANEVATFRADHQRFRLQRELRDHGRSRTELTAVRKDGVPVEVEAVITAVHDRAGAVFGFLGVHRDITERRRAVRHHEQLSALVAGAQDAVVLADLDGRVTYVNDAGRRLVGAEDGGVAELFAEADRDRVRDEVLPDVMRGARRTERLRLHDRRGGPPVPAGCQAFRVDDPETQRPLGVAVVARDLRQEPPPDAHDPRAAEVAGARRAEQQAVLARLGARAGRTEDVTAFLEDAVRQIARAAGATAALVAERSPGGGRLVVRAASGLERGDGAEVGTTDPGDLLGRALADGAVAVDDVRTAGLEVAAALRSLRPVAAAVVPVPGDEDDLGVLAVLSQEPSVPEDVAFLQAAAHALAARIERARTAHRLRRAREDERQGLVRTLHDEALQDARYALARAADPADGAAPDPLLVDALRRVDASLGRVVYDARPAAEDRPFAAVLAELVEQHRRMAPGLRIDLRVAGADEPAPDAVEELRHVLGEALTNVRRHAGARRVRVRSWTTSGQLWCDVADDGRAPAPEALSGRGITDMRERAARLGGRLDVTRRDGGGTAVRVRVPLVRPRAGDAPVRVLLVEDHAAVREAIAAAFRREPDLVVTGEVATLADAREHLDDVDVVVVDLALPDGDGCELVAELREAAPSARALVLSAGLDRPALARTIERGAAGALPKTTPLPEVLDAVRRVHRGETLLPLDEVVELLRFAGRERERELLDRQAIESLTSREREVLQLIADGLDSRRAAERLHISVRTQRNHVASILAKLGVHSQLQALIFALRYELVELRSPVS